MDIFILLTIVSFSILSLIGGFIMSFILVSNLNSRLTSEIESLETEVKQLKRDIYKEI